MRLIGLVLALVVGLAAFAGHAEDVYKHSAPLDNLNVPLLPPGSQLNWQKDRTPGASDQLTGYPPLAKVPTVPMIGLSITTPIEERK